MKDGEKKQRTAVDRWWERWTDRWRKYKAQYWFLVSSGVCLDAHLLPLYALLSLGLNTSFLCQSLISAANGSFCKSHPCSGWIHCHSSVHPEMYLHICSLQLYYGLIGFCYNAVEIHQLDFPKNPPLTSTFCCLTGITGSLSVIIINPKSCVVSWQGLSLCPVWLFHDSLRRNVYSMKFHPRMRWVKATAVNLDIRLCKLRYFSCFELTFFFFFRFVFTAQIGLLTMQ